MLSVSNPSMEDLNGAPPEAAAGARSPVHLVCLPFQLAGLSSLSTALLATYLRERGFSAFEHYLHFPFAELVGPERYRRISESASLSQLGELLFAEGVHGGIEDREQEGRLAELFGAAAARRDLRQRFAEACLDRLAAVDEGLVGFTTSFHQLLPSLWLARMLKAQHPGLRTVFGGAACSEPMGQAVFDGYPAEVSYVVSGYGERPLVRLAGGEETRQRAVLADHTPMDLDELPVPDYGAFLDQAGPDVERPGGLMLAFETSRGCWWGQKSHCTFCGLNQLELGYKFKTSERSFEEIRGLWRRFGFNLFATDTILARSHLKEVLPRLAELDDKPTLFYEVKSNMRRGEVEALRAANVRWVQPGIESLSSPLLKLLHKGVTAIQNVAFLKWCREQQVLVSWNLLCGIPGEEVEHYDEQLRLMRRIPHLSPPQGVSPIRVDRYSPYFVDHREFGWSELIPQTEYRSLHPHLDDEALHEIAYHFEGVGIGFHLDTYYPRLENGLDEWQKRHEAGDGLYWDARHGLMRVEGGAATPYETSEVLDRVLAATDDVTSVDRLLDLPGVDEALLEGLVEDGILYRERRSVVNLAVRLPEGLFAAVAA